ncbi:MAG: hypothetical protein V1778_04340 [bacterium]
MREVVLYWAFQYAYVPVLTGLVFLTGLRHWKHESPKTMRYLKAAAVLVPAGAAWATLLVSVNETIPSQPVGVGEFLPSLLMMIVGAAAFYRGMQRMDRDHSIRRWIH